jgi:glutathione S-transferase
MNDLSDAMPVNIRGRYCLTELSGGVQPDIQRVVTIWDNSLAASGGPWLFGGFTATDIVFAPIATRFKLMVLNYGASKNLSGSNPLVPDCC